LFLATCGRASSPEANSTQSDTLRPADSTTVCSLDVATVVAKGERERLVQMTVTTKNNRGVWDAPKPHSYANDN